MAAVMDVMREASGGGFFAAGALSSGRFSTGAESAYSQVDRRRSDVSVCGSSKGGGGHQAAATDILMMQELQEAASILAMAVGQREAEAIAPLVGAGGSMAFPSKRVLDWGAREMMPEHAAKLAALLRMRQGPNGSWLYNKSLRRILLPVNSIGDKGAEAIASALMPRRNPEGSWAYFRALTVLNLSGNGIGSQGCAALAEAIRPRQRTAGKGAGASYLASCSAIESLMLEDNNIGPEGAMALARAIAVDSSAEEEGHQCWVFSPVLKTIALNGNRIGDEGAQAIADALRRPNERASDGSLVSWAFNPTLKTLLLGRNGITAEGVRHVARALNVHRDADGSLVWNSALTCLSLAGNAIGSEGAKVLAAKVLRPHRCEKTGAWVYHSNLRSLALGGEASRGGIDRMGCGLGDKGAGFIARALGGFRNKDGIGSVVFNGSLEALNLAGNGISDHGAVCFAQALMPCLQHDNSTVASTALRMLNLTRNSVGHRGALELAEALRVRAEHSEPLHKLELGNNALGDQGAAAIAELIRSSGVKNIDLSGNGVTDEGAQQLAGALEVPGVVSINLDDNKIGDAGARAIAGAIAVLPQARCWGSLDRALSELLISNDGNEAPRPSGALLSTPPAGMRGSWPPGPEGRLSSRKQQQSQQGHQPDPEFLNLHTLSLTGNSIGCKGVRYIAEALQPRTELGLSLCCGLEVLRLSGNSASSKSFVFSDILLPAVTNLNRLRTDGRQLSVDILRHGSAAGLFAARW